ncbi:ribonuclease 3 [Geothrix rubra]|uniref:Ribonuclease 3 n=1 Tax=Geothrix rubra TaxID=2927977 RepID=A0ABQ5Q4X7_9BACT|nr:ribonuclease III domain-containing protein [Geothrix rubra]GLH69802.1 ribonuclease 3 [Geothrix rubra]
MAARRDGTAALEARLGHAFRNPAFLREALTHASSGRGRDNQRLEFLGDALLNFCVALAIHRERPDWEEGPMSKLRGVLVCTEALHAWALDLGLDQALSSAGRTALGPKPLADAVEALLAAVFLDAQAAGGDGASRVQALVEARHLAAIRSADPGLWTRRDAKTTLQETTARLGLPAPAYTLLGQSGPDHAPRFSVRAATGPHVAEAEGNTRKKAETEAARKLLDLLGPGPSA